MALRENWREKEDCRGKKSLSLRVPGGNWTELNPIAERHRKLSHRLLELTIFPFADEDESCLRIPRKDDRGGLKCFHYALSPHKVSQIQYATRISSDAFQTSVWGAIWNNCNAVRGDKVIN